MADISKIKPNGTEYNLKDAAARNAIQSSKTLKSSVVTVTDAYPINAEDITVDIEPIQDLHGYDRPWAGGAGKNKCPINDIVVGANTSEAITDKILIGNQKTYTISMIIARISGVTVSNNALYPAQIRTYDSNDTQVDVINPSPIDLTSGSTTFQTSFTVSDNASYMIVNLRNRNSDGNNNTRKYNVQLEIGNQATTFAPYSNICPIEGRTGAELDRVGKNWFDKDSNNTSKGYKDNVYLYYNNVEGSADGWYISEYIRVPSIGSITLSGGRGNDPALCFYDADKHYISGVAYSSIMPRTFSIPSNSAYIRLSVPKNSKDTLQLELGSTATTYEPYQGEQYTASFGETVHGGKWHVTAGGTDKTHANIANYNGETINEPWLSSLDEYSPGATPTIGAQVVYPLTTPTTISTPKQNVPMLQGINTVYADCGDTQLKYQPDNVVGELKGEIRAVEAELAEVEENLEIVYEDHVANTSMGIIVEGYSVGDMPFSNALDIAKTGYIPIAVTDTSVVLSSVADQGEIATHCLLDVANNRVRFYVHVMDSAASLTIPPNSLTFRVAYKKA